MRPTGCCIFLRLGGDAGCDTTLYHCECLRLLSDNNMGLCLAFQRAVWYQVFSFILENLFCSYQHSERMSFFFLLRSSREDVLYGSKCDTLLAVATQHRVTLARAGLAVSEDTKSLTCDCNFDSLWEFLVNLRLACILAENMVKLVVFLEFAEGLLPVFLPNYGLQSPLRFLLLRTAYLVRCGRPNPAKHPN